MTPAEWLRAVAVWSPWPKLDRPQFCTLEESIALMASVLPMRFPPEVFCEATVKLMARQCETFPNYYWCCKILGDVA